ncbi:MAG: ABC transporter substrate-binding protein [Jatrophihabitantaceae bacterium]
MSPKVAFGAVSLLGAAVILAGCGGSDGNDNNSGDDKAASARGPITFVTGKDNSGLMPHLAQEWNAAHPNEKVTIKQQSDQADQQLSDLQQHFQAKDPSYDVVTVDVVWTAEFAAKGWVIPLEGQYQMDTSKLLGPTVDAATYNDKLYAAPYASDAGLLYYRKDLVSKAPTTWDEMIAACKGKTGTSITGSQPACYAGQFAKYEGLTVNGAEAINSAGGQIVKDDGKTPNVMTDEAKKGLEFLVNGFKQGYIPKEALGFQETQSLNAFQAGQLMFMRNWPYANAILAGAGSKVAGKFDIAPLPGPTGPGASSLGGHSVAISTYSKYKATGLDFLKFIQSDAVQSYNLSQGSQAPVIESLYSDPELVKKFPYLPVLAKGIENAIPRPVTPFYPAVTEAIQTNVYAAIQGTSSVEDALKNLQAAIESGTAG